MPVPETIFNADECQALLDYIERLEWHVKIVQTTVPDYGEAAFRLTDEESDALKKLRKAGEFYVR